MVLFPISESAPGFFQFLCNQSSRITVPRPTMPSGVNGFSETGTVGPVVFESEEFGFRNVSSNVDDERNVIRSASS